MEENSSLCVERKLTGFMVFFLIPYNFFFKMKIEHISDMIVFSNYFDILRGIFENSYSYYKKKSK